MKNKFLNFLFIILMLFTTLTFVGVQKATAVDSSSVSSTKGISFTKEGKLKAPSVPEKNIQDLTKIEKQEKTKPLFKFLTAMLWVFVSSAVIFGVLSLYKKIKKTGPKQDNINYQDSLYTPKDFKEAINQFLNKTDK